MKEQQHFSIVRSTSGRITVVEDTEVSARVDDLIAIGLLDDEVWRRFIDQISALTGEVVRPLREEQTQAGLFAVLQISEQNVLVAEVLVGRNEANIVKLLQATLFRD